MSDDVETSTIYLLYKMLNFFKIRTEFKEPEKAKLYIAIIRAMHVVGIIVSKNFKSNFINLPYWS